MNFIYKTRIIKNKSFEVSMPRFITRTEYKLKCCKILDIIQIVVLCYNWTNKVVQ